MVALVPHSPRARFEFRLPISKEGTYRVLTRSVHSLSAHSLYDAEINGQRSTHTFQGFYAQYPGVGLAQSELDDWGVFHLTPDHNRMVLRPQIEYARKRAVTRFLYCVDAFVLIPTGSSGK